MQKIESMLKKIVSNNDKSTVAEVHNDYKVTPNNSDSTTHDHIDAINQMFAEFELAYHNQYHKAYAQEGSVALAKKYWLSCLSDLAPEIILRATRKVVSTQEYLPSVASIIQSCEDVMSLFGLSTPQKAFVEACCAPQPKASFNWSHSAVYLAGKTTGWFELANQSEKQIFPLFEYNYKSLCNKVLKGEDMTITQSEALPQAGSLELSSEENLKQLEVLKKTIGFK